MLEIFPIYITRELLPELVAQPGSIFHRRRSHHYSSLLVQGLSLNHPSRAPLPQAPTAASSAQSFSSSSPKPFVSAPLPSRLVLVSLLLVELA